MINEAFMKNERHIWTGMTSFFVFVILLAAFSPVALLAQSGSLNSHYSRIFSELMRFIQGHYVDEVDEKTLFEGAMKGMFESLNDPYSVYLTEDDMEALSDTTTGEFGGVGLYISKMPDDRYVRVVAPIEDTPAYKLGINAGDLIIKIEDMDTEGMALDEVTDQLRGEPGTDVNITFLRGENITFTHKITRAVIQVPSVKFDYIDKETAYLRIIQFTPNTPEKVKEALKAFNKKDIKYLVIDLRSNPGGVLNAVCEIADYFLDSGIIVSTKSKLPSENHVYKADKKMLLDKSVPIALLIDKGSASASEILAAALSDNGRGVLIGETTYGKGSVQQVHSIGLSGFKLTMSKYYTPEDKNIDKVGIPPLKEVKEKEFTDEEMESYKKLVEEFTISNFVKDNPKPSEREINNFIKKLRKDNIVLEERVIRKMIRNELNLKLNNPPVFDMEYDIVLQEAVKMLENGEIKVK